MSEVAASSPKKKDAHIWERDLDDHYVEPEWCSQRLFDVENFDGDVYDPACGFGRILDTALANGLKCRGSDIVDRGVKGHEFEVLDFLSGKGRKAKNIVTNPPFKLGREFALRALAITESKVAMILPTRRLNAMHSWIVNTPLYQVWLLTPRPSMPPGTFIKGGGKPGGGTIDFCWMVWQHGFVGKPAIGWLHRDGAAS